NSALAASLQATTPEALRAAAPDAIVIGAGAAGGLAALLLAEAGLRVLVLDAGPPRPPAAWSWPSLVGTIGQWAAGPTGLQRLHPTVASTGRRALRILARRRQPIQSQCFAWALAPAAFVDDRDCPYETEPLQPFIWLRARQLGGRMIIPGHGRQYYRMAPENFSPGDGLSAAWPLAPGELDPWYALVERRLQIAGALDRIPSLPDC